VSATPVEQVVDGGGPTRFPLFDLNTDAVEVVHVILEDRRVVNGDPVDPWVAWCMRAVVEVTRANVELERLATGHILNCAHLLAGLHGERAEQVTSSETPRAFWSRRQR